MGEWGVALITAGAAVAGGLVTGWFGRSAGVKQADAARHAGERQAEALLDSVRLTIEAEARQRSVTLRRQVYAEFLGVAEARILAERTGRGQPDDAVRLQTALGSVVLEGPAEVAAAAQHLLDGLRRHGTPDELGQAKLAFISAAQEALNRPGPSGVR
ncbi:hypothetical protein [Streptomyces sp. NPDC048172]|uniref:hypothetical protein n=1 Tax=Streptomyces sp. NPDC048172 TaxID=3365505 RepID=UPI00372000BC